MMIISGFEIRCERFEGEKGHRLTVTVKQYGGPPLVTSMMLEPSDIESRFDFMWNMLGERFKEEMKKRLQRDAEVTKT